MALMHSAGLKAVMQASDFHWKYWCERSDWPSPRSYVMTNGPDILAHIGIIPSTCLCGTRRLLLIHAIEWAARSDVPGAGVALLKYVSKLADATLAIGGSLPTRRILPFLGFRAFGTAIEYVKWLHPIRPVSATVGAPWQDFPRYVRDVAWIAATRIRCARWEAERIDASEVDALTPWLSRVSADAVVIERSEALIRHALQCPIARIELYGLKRSGRTRGYFMLAFVPNESRLIDGWVDSADPADWRGMIHCAVERSARDRSVLSLTALSSVPELCHALHQCGFRNVQELPIHLLGAEPSIPDRTGIRVQLLDYNGAYLWYSPRAGAASPSVVNSW